MYKKGGVWVLKTLTDVWSKQPNGTLHAYHYFENDDETWIYNIDFHHKGCFAPVQLVLSKRIAIKRAIKKARKIYENTNYIDQPSWND